MFFITYPKFLCEFFFYIYVDDDVDDDASASAADDDDDNDNNDEYFTVRYVGQSHKLTFGNKPINYCFWNNFYNKIQ